MELRLRNVNTGLLKDFLYKLVPFEKFAYITITNETITSRSHLKTKDVIKVIELRTRDVFEFEGNIESPLKVIFVNPAYTIKNLDFLNGETVDGSIVYNEQYKAEKFMVWSLNEKINLYCADPRFSSFYDMTDDEVEVAFATNMLQKINDTEKYLAKFNFNMDILDKIKKRVSINKDEEKFKLRINKGCIYLITKNNELLLADDASIYDESIKEISMSKKYLNFLDKETYTLHLCTDKFVFESKISETKIAIASAIRDFDETDLTEDDIEEKELYDDFEFSEEF